MIRIVNKEYSSVQPQMPSKNAIAVFNVEDAKIVFMHASIDFVIALNEKTMQFKYCYSVQECFEYFSIAFDPQ